MKNLAIGFILGLIVAGAVCAYNAVKKITAPSVLATPAKELAKAEKETLKCVPVIIYKDRAKKAIGLPEPVVEDVEQRLLGATQVKPSERPTTVSAVLNTKTGESTFYQRHDPAPWLAFDHRWRFGAFYGLSDSENGLFLGVAEYQAARIKMVQITAHGQVDTSGRYFLGAGLSW